MKKYRKTQTIEVVKKATKEDKWSIMELKLPLNDGTFIITVGQVGDYWVQNTGDDTDRWVIPKEVFESTYEEVK